MKLLKKPPSRHRFICQGIIAGGILSILLGAFLYCGFQKIRAIPEYATKAGVLKVRSVFVSPSGKGYVLVQREYTNPFLKEFKEMELASMNLEASESRLTAKAKVGNTVYTGDSTNYPVKYNGQHGIFRTYYTISLNGQIPETAAQILVDVDGRGEKPYQIQRLDGMKASKKDWLLEDGKVSVEAYALSQSKSEVIVRCKSESSDKLSSPRLYKPQMGGRDGTLQYVIDIPLETSAEETLTLYWHDKRKSKQTFFQVYTDIDNLFYQGLTFSHYPQQPIQLEVPTLHQKGESSLIGEEVALSTNARLQDVETVYGEWGQYVNLDISALSDHLSLYELAYRFVPEKKTSNLKFYDYIPNISSGRVEIPCAIRKDLPSTTLEICALTYYHPAVGWAFGAESDRQKGR